MNHFDKYQVYENKYTILITQEFIEKYDEDTLNEFNRRMICSNLSLFQLKSMLAPNFDQSKRKHDHITAKLGKYEIDNVDKDLAPLLERINRLSRNELFTFMSCQYDSCGWSYIRFTYDGFKQFLFKLRKQHEKKYGPVTKSNHNFVGFYKHFINWGSDKLQVVVGEWAGTLQTEFSVVWTFQPDNIPLLIEEFDDLFYEKTKKTKKVKFNLNDDHSAESYKKRKVQKSN
jgi:hypothetical protein